MFVDKNTSIGKTGWLKIKKVADLLGGSFWFIPSIMISASIAGAILLERINVSNNTFSQYFAWFTTDSAETSMQLLQIIATSAITVTSIAFSMTLIALTMASNQFGPRLLRNFMQDKRTQFVLGCFTSTFIYCLIVISQISVISDYTVNPILSVAVAKLLAIICVFLLIYFIHHVAISISADTIVEDVFQSILRDLTTVQKVHKTKRAAGAVHFDEQQFSYQQTINTHHCGYLQAIDYNGIQEVAKECSCVIKLQLRAGKYILPGSEVAIVYSHSPISSSFSLCSHFVVGSQRTPLQDPEYAINQLVEMALRALSPSLNDPFTAINCINKIASAMSTFTPENIPKTLILDDNDELRVITNEESITDIFCNAFNQIRQNSDDHIAVTIHLLDTFLQVLSLEQENEFLFKAISHQVDAIKEQVQQLELSAIDKQSLEDRFLLITKRIEKNKRPN